MLNKRKIVNFWKEFYSNNYHQNIEPNETLIRFIKSYDKKKLGTVLDLSAGNGRNTLWLKKNKIKTISSELNKELLKNIKNRTEYKVILDLKNQKTFKNILKHDLKTIISVSTFYHVDSNNLSKFVQYVTKHCSLNFMFCNFLSSDDRIFKQRKKITLTNHEWINTNKVKNNRTNKLTLYSYSRKNIKKIFKNFRKVYFFRESLPINFHFRKAPKQKKLIWVLAIN